MRNTAAIFARAKTAQQSVRKSIYWVSPRICSRTLMAYSDAPRGHPISVLAVPAAACYLLFMLTVALLMTSSHSEGTGKFCGWWCEGDSCSRYCTGDSCGNECTGPSCACECTGNDCGKDCTGPNCGKDFCCPGRTKVGSACVDVGTIDAGDCSVTCAEGTCSVTCADAQTVTIHSLRHKYNIGDEGKMELINLAEITAFDGTDTEIDPITAAFASDDSSTAAWSSSVGAGNCIDGDGDTMCHSKGSNPTFTITYPASPVIHRITVQNVNDKQLWRRIAGATLTIRNAKGKVLYTDTLRGASESYEFLKPPAQGSLTAGDGDGDDIGVPGVLDEIELAAATARATPGNCNDAVVNAAPPRRHQSSTDLTTTITNLRSSLAAVSTLLAVGILQTSASINNFSTCSRASCPGKTSRRRRRREW